MVFILFDFIFNIPVNKFSVMSAHSTKIKMRGSRERVLEEGRKEGGGGCLCGGGWWGVVGYG